MRKFASRAKRGLFVLSALPLAFAMAAQAAGPADVAPSLRASMQRDLGMTPAQMAQYLSIERLATLQQDRLARAQGASFAGSWIERQANGHYKLVVATTSSPQAAGADMARI